MNEKIKKLKQQLTAEIQKENSDNSLILSLSNEIAKLDDTGVRFSVDAGIINRLGKELVGRHETAVSELVKNAYDADSKNDLFTFEAVVSQPTNKASRITSIKVILFFNATSNLINTTAMGIYEFKGHSISNVISTGHL